MSSFSKMARFTPGYYRAISSWLLRNRRDVVRRVQVINAEVDRIGFIRCLYEGVEDETGNTIRSEKRLGVVVTEGSSIGRLVQAYVALGGNPLDISPFMYPDTTQIVETLPDGSVVISEEYPFGGVIAPKSVDAENPVDDPNDTGYGSYQGGRSESAMDYSARLRGRNDRGLYDSDAIVKTFHMTRRWANQEIKERLQDMEWRIIKLADLREQLVAERDEILVQAFGGYLGGVPDRFDDDRFMRGFLVQNLVQDMYELLYQMNDDGSVASFTANVDTGLAYFIVPPKDKSITTAQVSEIRDPMGG
jgi:hypothetical protein